MRLEQAKKQGNQYLPVIEKERYYCPGHYDSLQFKLMLEHCLQSLHLLDLLRMLLLHNQMIDILKQYQHLDL